MDWILKVLVGSRAHGLSTSQSDYDYRGVFVQPTSVILGLSGVTQHTHWVEGRDVAEGGKKEDDTAWEIGHFLKLATHCNPSILEVFAAPVEHATDEGEELRALLPYIWHPKGVRDAFIGYGLNQRKKMLEGKDSRPYKYAVAYLRVLCQAERLLTHKHLLVDFTRHEEYQTLLLFKNRMASPGDVINKCLEWQERVEAAAETCNQKPNLEPVEQFLLNVRRKHWEA
jgi:predicted nucleotidyltransferase